MANLILIAEAAEQSTYSTNHIGLLLRQGKVKGKKVGGTWLVDIDDLQIYEQRMEEMGTQKHTPKKNGQ